MDDFRSLVATLGGDHGGFDFCHSVSISGDVFERWPYRSNVIWIDEWPITI
jgi:hypothetical protein